MEHHYPRKVYTRIHFWNGLKMDVSGYPLSLLGLSQVSFTGLVHSSACSLQPLWPQQDLPCCPSLAFKEPSPHLRPLALTLPWTFPLLRWSPWLSAPPSRLIHSSLHGSATLTHIQSGSCQAWGDEEWNGFFKSGLFGGRNKCHLNMAFLLPSYL